MSQKINLIVNVLSYISAVGVIGSLVYAIFCQVFGIGNGGIGSWYPPGSGALILSSCVGIVLILGWVIYFIVAYFAGWKFFESFLVFYVLALSLLTTGLFLWAVTKFY